MIEEAEHLLRFRLLIAQGSYSTGTAASAGTHSGGGAFDFTIPRSAKFLWFKRKKKVNETVEVLRRVGFAAWYRSSKEGPWNPHIHCIAVDCHDLAPAAARQVAALRRGENGLKNQAEDPHADLHLPVISWEQYLAKRDRYKSDPVPVAVPAVKPLPPGDAVVTGLQVVKPGKRTLRKGMSGTDVEYVQRKIGKNRCGAPDGEFGEKTAAGVRAYQRARHLSPSGVVGPVLWKKLL